MSVAVVSANREQWRSTEVSIFSPVIKYLPKDQDNDFVTLNLMTKFKNGSEGVISSIRNPLICTEHATVSLAMAHSYFHF